MQGPPIVHTHQLILRAPEPADVDPLFEIQGDSGAMQFTYWAPDRGATARYLEVYARRFAQDGFAPWTAILKGENRVVGWGGLNRDPEAPQWGPEVVYLIHPAYWGRGLATELVTASLKLAFHDLELAEVGAFTKPQNRASSRVLRKVGFSFVRHVPELERDQFSLRERDWRDKD